MVKNTVIQSNIQTNSPSHLKRSYCRETVYRSSELSRFQTYSQCAVVRGQRSGHHAASQSPDDGGSIMTIRWRLQTKVDEENNVVYTIREYRPTTWAFLLGPAGSNSLLFLLLTYLILLATLNTLLG